MHSLRHLALFAFGYFLTFGLPAVAQDPSILDSGVAITTANETTTLNRDTRRLQSSLLVTVANTGSSLIEAPLHVAVGFTELNGASLDGLNVPGTLGGPGQAPYNASYFDCSAKAGGDGLAPGESFELTIAFDRPRTMLVRYDLQLAGFVNQPPVAVSDAPYRGTVDEDVTLDASLSSDPEGGGLTFAWTLPNGSTLNGPTVQASFAQAGLQQVALAVTDDRGATTSDQVEVVVLPPGEFALARTRVLDGLGHPLDAIDVSEEGPNGSTQFSLRNGGFGSLGSVPGDYLWRFSKPGHLTVCRRATLLAGEVSVVPNPWMPKLSTAGTTLSVINDSTIATPDGALQFMFPGGAFAQPGEAFLTELHGQSLPGALPAGWSPLAAFHLALPQAPLQAGTLTATLPEGVPAGPQLLLARFDEANCEWIAREFLTPDNGTVTAAMTSFGSFAILLADADPTAPPAATVNAALPAFPTAPQIAGVTASGEVDPAEAVASRLSSAITAQATVAFTGPAALPSGTWFQADAREHYELSNGQSIIVPAFDQTYYAYRGLGADSSIVTAEFPIRPSLLFGPEELNVARVQVDVLGRVTFAGGVVAPGGGILASGPISLTLPSGALMNPAAAGLRLLSPDDFAAFADGIVSAFALDIGDLAPGTELAFAFNAPVTPNANFLLAKLSTAGSRSGLQPVTRLASDANGNLTSIEPASEPRLNGIRGPGSYLLLQSPAPLALIQGRTLDPGNAPFPGAAVSVVSAPWLGISNSGGNYELVDTAGPGSLLAQDLETGDAGTASFTVDPALAPLAIDLTIGPAGPSVIATSPPAGATGVSRVVPISVTFSEAIHPGTFDSTAVVLRFTNNGAAVPAALTLAPGNTVATLLATNPLDYDTDFIIDVGPHLTDPTGLPLEGNRFFGFKTEPAPVRAAGAQLVIYEPGAQMIPQDVLDDLVGYRPGVDRSLVVATGTQGTADPEVPVILVNDSTGETATVLSKPDGSFASFLIAGEEDFIKAVFVNANGTRVTVPATRQLYDDGSIGLYEAGGILEAQSDGGPVQVIIEPGAIQTRNKFRLNPLTLTEVLGLLGGVTPEVGQIAGALELEVTGEPLDGQAEVTFPVDENTPIPEGGTLENAAIGLTIAREIDGQQVFQLVDKMKFDGEKLTTASPPYDGLPDAMAEYLPGADLFRFLVVPIILGVQPVTLVGNVYRAPQLTQGAGPVSQNGQININNLLSALATGPLSAAEEFALIASGVAKPLPGAFIAVRPPNITQRPGSLQAGMIYATSGRDGSYAMVLPSNVGGFILRATHPRFNEVKSEPVFPFLEQGLFSLTVRRNLFFQNQAGFDTPPRVSVTHAPRRPAVGEAATLNITASSGLVQPPTLLITILEVIGPDATTQDATLMQIGMDEIDGTRIRRTYELTCTKPADVRLKISVVGQGGGSNDLASLTYRISFGGAVTPVPNVVEQADPNDSFGPTVVFSDPQEGGVLPPDGLLRLQFSEPLDASAANNLSAYDLSGPDASDPAISLSPDQREVTLGWTGLRPGQDYSLTVSNAITDLAGNALDQDPLTDGEQAHVLTFATAPVVTGILSEVESGGGITFNGSIAYVLERDGPGSVKIFDVSDPTLPVFLSELILNGYPRDLALVENWSYFPSKPDAHAGNSVTGNLLLVSGGNLGSSSVDDDGNVFVDGQYLAVINVDDPANPGLLVKRTVTRRPSAVRKLQWDRPLVTYLESGADLQQIGFVDLQELIIGFNLGASTLPFQRVPGQDLNNDGDYTDPGDSFPIPARNPVDFGGKVFGLVLEENSSRRIRDYHAFRGNCGVALSSGRDFDSEGLPTGTARPAALKMLLANGFDIDQELGELELPADPQRMIMLFNQQVETDSGLKTLDLALVSLSNNSLEVVDVSLPETPVSLVNIPIPAQFGVLKNIENFGRGSLSETLGPSAELFASLSPSFENGRLTLATSTHRIVLDPLKLGLPVPGSGPHPALVGFIANTGSGNISIAETSAGLFGVSLGGRSELTLAPPEMAILSFPTETQLVDPSLLDTQGAAALETMFARSRVETKLSPARYRSRMGQDSDLSTPNPQRHYHVVVHTPGGAGDTLTLSLESLNRAAYPYKNKGRNFPPVRAMSADGLTIIEQTARPGCDAPIPSLTAHRLSSELTSPFYNVYLSEPFALSYERITNDQLQQLQNQAVIPRPILWAGYYLRATIDHTMESHPIVGPFAAQPATDDHSMVTRCGITVPSLPGFYNMGTNPPPNGGTVSAPGTFGTVATHSGEVRTDTVDMSLPGRRLPIVFERSIGGQDLYDGPFGRGWDFNYNQHLIEIDPNVLSGDTRIPLIDKKEDDDDVYGDARDILFSTGAGRIVRFRHVDQTVPPEIAQDPLVTDLGWDEDATDFYLPEKGVFDILVRFPSGQFARLTPDGTQFWYRPDGRLETIYHRYEKNYQVLAYNRRDELVKITDKSVTADRFLEIGYYRLQNDPLFESGLDRNISQNPDPSPYIAGKIARLKDYTDRDILYEYDEDGVLVKRLGVELNGDNNGFSGRQKTDYLWDAECDFRGIVTGGGGANQGTALYSTSLEKDEELAQASATDGSGAAGSVSITTPPDDSSATEDETVTVTGPDDENTAVKFDDHGYPKEIMVSGDDGPSATFMTEYSDLGLVEKVTHPEGNITTYEYDVDNDSWRSRGNLLSIKSTPGPRGGDPGELEATWDYDERYNLPSETHEDYNGNSIAYSLTGDHKDIESIDYPGDGIGSETFEYNGYGQPEKHVEPAGTSQSWGYDDATGFVTSYKQGDVETVLGYGGGTASDLGKPDTVTPPSGDDITYEYDARLMMTSSKRGGLEVLQGYDENGNLVYSSRALGGGDHLVQRFMYDQINFLEEHTMENIEIDGQDTALVATYVPDEAFRVKSVTYTPGDRKFEYEYDHRGFLTRVSVGDYTETYEVDLHGNVTEVFIGGELVRETTYDGHDRPILVTHKAGSGDETSEFTYYGNGEIKTRVVTGVDGVDLNMEIPMVDSIGRPLAIDYTGTDINPSSSYTYTSLSGNGTTTVTTGPRNLTTLQVDGAGRPTSLSDSLSTITYPQYDGFNLKRTQSVEDGTTFTLESTFNGLDHVMSISDDLGAVFSYAPRLDGRPTTVTDARGKITSQDFSVLGEILERARPNGITFNYEYSQHREPTFVGGAEGRATDYDETYRPNQTTFRDGSTATINQFDGRNNPTNIALPGGGTVDDFYDLQSRLCTSTVSFGGTSYKLDLDYDGLSRPTSVDFGDALQNNITYDYDKAGPIRKIDHDEGGFEYSIHYGLYEDRTTKSCTYPSGVVVDVERENNGRLTKVSTTGGGTICHMTEFFGAGEPSRITHGPNLIEQTNRWDKRRRLLSTEYRRSSDSALLAGMSFRYDDANNVTARQYLHRNGRLDQFVVDDGNRITDAVIGGRPAFLGEPTAATGFDILEDGFAPGYVARNFQFGADDIITASPASSYDPAVALPFAETYGAYDGFLVAGSTDGFDRATDALGNTTRVLLYVRTGNGVTQVTPVGATLTFNGRNELVRVERDDDVTIDYQYRHDGLVHRRTVTDNSTITHDTAWTWDGGRLVEEFEFAGAGSGQLLRRYYYGDGDAPTAADLRQPGGQLRRFYFLCDNLYTVVALADENAEVAERYHYDTYGQVVIEAADTSPPVVRRLLGHPEGLVVEFSEPVFALLAGSPAPGEITSTTVDLSQAFALMGTSEISVSAEFDPTRSGSPHGTAILLRAASTNLAPLTLTLAANEFTDEWANRAPADSISFQGNTTAGAVLFERPGASTGPEQVPVSPAGSPFLYHGQYFDQFVGLYYMRARWYDPFTGQFLSRDPRAYVDSTNPNAGFGHNGASFRDPTGLAKGVKVRKGGGAKALPTGPSPTGHGAARRLGPEGTHIHSAEDLRKIHGSGAPDANPGSAKRSGDSPISGSTDQKARPSGRPQATPPAPPRKAPPEFFDLLADDDISRKDLKNPNTRRGIDESRPQGFIDIIIHGTKGGQLQPGGSSGKVLSPKQVADYIEANGYRGQNIRLLVCHAAGANPSSPAPIVKYLQQRFGVDVLASTTQVNISPSRGVYSHLSFTRSGEKITVSSPLGKGKLAIEGHGHWILFKKGGGRIVEDAVHSGIK